MELLKGVFNTGLGMGTGAVSDTVKLVVIGGTVETARRVARSSWNSFLDCESDPAFAVYSSDEMTAFFLTAHFTQNDTPYEWIMHWLSKQPAWGRSREFDITTRTVRKGAGSAGDFEDEDEEATIVKGNTRSMIAFMPAQDTTHTIYYRGHWLRTHSTTRDKKSTGAPTVSEKATEPDGNTLTLSGLLNAIDGVTAPEGRILIATTNHIDRLDEALRRPGRMDVWINFKHATKWQAEGIFKRFFPIKPKVSSGLETPVSPSSSPTSPAHQLPALRTALADDKLQKSRKIPLNALDEDELNELAHRFGQLIPEDEVSVAALQGYLLKNKSRPRECVDEVSAWIVEERERKEKLKKEKEEKERKEKEEQEKKEKEEETKKAEEEETKKADELAAARKAYRKAKRAATTAKTTTESTSTTTETGLQTPPAEDSTATSSTATESADESSSGEESSSADDDKKKKRRKAKSKSGKDKWVAVSKATAAEESPAETKAEETNDAEEDTSAVDALVDAATQISTEQTA
ncbi:related to BCS1 protein precursor [Serendipita indica DSM 11827]|uniref:Related to BCS1 protein n=1 Tax=Serendipita indica (strain DSM 11827) TaxID=1109443 RepID=G4TWQ6_SERID|nr:related to BCS1 protein precursor [Serendipita indica DSM 11827]